MENDHSDRRTRRSHALRRRLRVFGALAVVAVTAAVTAGCYTVRPLPSGSNGRVTHVFAADISCGDVAPPRLPPDCCDVFDLPNGIINELAPRSVWYRWTHYAESEPRYMQNLLGIYMWWYDNGFTREEQRFGCFNQQDVIYYMDLGPAHRYWRWVKSHNQPFGVTTLLSEGTGHKWNP